MKNIVLIGMMGSGKSSVGNILSQKLGLTLFDTDLIIQERQGRKITELFFDTKVDFRNCERLLLLEMKKLKMPAVVATGGGAVTVEGGLNIIKNIGEIFYLKASPLVLAKRIFHDKSTRPLLVKINSLEMLGKRIEVLLSERRAMYETADYTIDTDLLTPYEISETILSKRPNVLSKM